MASTLQLRGYIHSNLKLKEAAAWLHVTVTDSNDDLFVLNAKVQQHAKDHQLPNRNSKFTFYKPRDLKFAPLESLAERVKSWLLDHFNEALHPLLFGTVQEIWENEKPSTKVDFIAVDEQVLEELQLLHNLQDSALYPRVPYIQEHLFTIRSFENVPSPSYCSHHPEKVLDDPNLLCAGRPVESYGPSNALFDPRLATLIHKLGNLESADPPTHEMLGFAERLVTASAKVYSSENLREQAVIDLLKIMFPKGEYQTSLTHHTAKPEAFWFHQLIFKLGSAGDPQVLVLVDYMKILDDKALSGPLKGRSNCPCVLLTLAGTELKISTAIITNVVHFQPLYSEDLRGGHDLAYRLVRLARALQAVKDTFNELSSFYTSIKADPNSLPEDGTHIFPNPVSTAAAGPAEPPLLDTLGLTFLHKLSRNGGQAANNDQAREANMSHAIYVAQSCETPSIREGLTTPVAPLGTKVVVKFVQRYNTEAHTILAKENLAPKLYHHCRVLGEYTMVVMDFVDCKTAWDLEKMRIQVMEQTVYEDVRKAIKHLHDQNIVFGDLRSPNIMVHGNNRAVLIDFDWAATEGEGRYPPRLSTEVE
ncbi:hypothetical protein D9758_016123 [Tetrapyrgos nigripes]|uniref:non-specific serine/threonine protein kinase n=1 Tax=Tetrapyrgos nigripes TaxID=182062 RepID=A0A8H5C0B4_9AGAR|nr:hypothetical protein D9758_016123 [Tetrapyrgos nigripes]